MKEARKSNPSFPPKSVTILILPDLKRKIKILGYHSSSFSYHAISQKPPKLIG
jgi:hypothetical protein